MTDAGPTQALPSYQDYLRQCSVPRALIADFLERPRWSQFDAELGYTLHDCLVQWGIDGSQAIATIRADGARSRFAYGGAKPRINSYGDSFTECNQVNDAETWQEYLAGHLGEPIGNYGVGGYGVYQTYLRMKRHEATEDGAPYVIFYIWGDDSIRSLMRARWPAAAEWLKRFPGNPWKGLFHGNAWSNIEMDLESGQFAERTNSLPTPDSLYAMCDPEWMATELGGDLALELQLYTSGAVMGLPGKIRAPDQARIERLAELLGVPLNRGVADPAVEALQLLKVYGQKASVHILEQARAFTDARGKKLLVVLNHTSRTDTFTVPAKPYDGMRGDQIILDHLVSSGTDYFDMNAVHEAEFQAGRDSAFSDYMRQYMVGGVGHYNPKGNHLFAYAIKDKLVELLDPKPLPYRDLQDERIDFRGYLPGA